MYIRSRQWYYYIKAESDREDKTHSGKGLLDDYSQQNLSSMTVCCMEHPKDGRKLYTVFDSYLDLGMTMKDIVPEARHFHEVIFGSNYQKPHFDIDVEPRPSDELAQKFINQLVSVIIEIFNTWPSLKFSLSKHMIICSSHGPEKLSYHVIIEGFIHTDHQEAEDFCYLVRSKLSPEFRDWLDLGIYSKLHQLRVLSSTKLGTDRIKQFQTSWQYQDTRVEFKYPITPESEDHGYMMRLQSSLITYISGCRSLPAIRSNLSEVTIATILPHRRKVTESYHAISDEVSKSAIRLLAELAETTPNSRSFPYRYQCTQGGLVLLTRTRASHCRICNRRHQHENPYLIVTPEHQVYFCCRRNKDGRKLYVGDLGFTEPEIESPVMPEIIETATEVSGESPLEYMKSVQATHELVPRSRPPLLAELTTNGLIDPNFIY